ncbi:MAG: toll/interleukin-1 receptor domain-containing protein [Rhodomicrobium sp.]
MLGWPTMIWGLATLGAGALFLAIVLIARKLFGARDDAEAAGDRPNPPAARVSQPASARQDAAPARNAPLPPLPGRYKYDYFISYNKEWDRIAALADEVLTRDGKTVSAWVQRYDSKRGDYIPAQVRSAIANSKHFIALLSTAYISRSWTLQELEWFVGHRLDNDYSDRKIIVLKCEDLGDREKDVPPDLNKVFYGTLFDKPDDDAKRAEISKALRGDGAHARPALHDYFDPEIRQPELFAGRESEIAQIAGYFFPVGAGEPDKARAARPPQEPRRVLLHAGPGFGKTSLARKFAHRFRPWFAGVYWLPSEEEAPLLAKIVRLGEAPAASDTAPTLEEACAALQARFGRALAPQLLIFDNVAAKTQQTVRRLLDGLPPSVRVISTAWSCDWDGNAKPIELRAFDPDDAAALLRTCAQSGDAPGSRSLAVKLSGHPLALNHAGVLCKRFHMSFGDYEQAHLDLLKTAPRQGDYERGAVYATVMLALKRAAELDEAARGDVARLADFLSYCAADRIPRSLYKQAIEDPSRLLAAVGALHDVALLKADAPFDGDMTVSMHRLVQRIVRQDADAEGRSPAVVDKLVPFLNEQLNDDANSDSGDSELRFRKYFPHLLQALPELDAPDFRGNETSDVLESVSKLVVLALKRQYATQSQSAAEEAYPERLPGLLGCFYEVDPLDEPLEFFLQRLHGRPKDWRQFRDACLGAENYVLRFALAKALAGAVGAGLYGRDEATQLVERPATFNHFELGGYALKDLYSKPGNFGDIDRGLLARLAGSECYSGASALGDLLLNLVYQKRDVRKVLPPEEGGNRRFWHPIWDHIAFDVNAIRAAEYHNRGETPPGDESEDVKAEHVYLLRLQAWRDELRRRFAGDAILSDILARYFSIGADPDWADDAEERFKALALSGELLPLLRLLFGHPLWSVAETAASVVAALLRKAKTAEEANAYVQLIEALFEPELPDEPEGSENPWRVRYGALEAAFQIRLHDRPKYATFFKGVRTCYKEPISRLRALCAENLLSVMLNASDRQRVAYEDEFKDEIERWLVDEDAWVLEHVYRYFHTLHKRAENERKDAAFAPSLSIARFMSGKQSPLFAGLDAWWKAERETVLKHIEAQKAERTGRPAETPAKAIAE